MRNIVLLVVIIILSGGFLCAQSGWVPIGPEGGFLYSFAIAPSSPNVLYAGCDAYGGIYKSTNSGDNWEFLGMLSDVGHVLDVDIHPDSSDIVYAACGRAGVYKTINGGLNWTPIFNREGTTYAFGIDPNFPNTVYAGVVVDTNINYALYKSTDAGTIWSDSNFLANPVLVIDFYPESLNTVYVGTASGVWRSTDAGTNWSWCGPADPSVLVYSLAIVDFNTFYIGTYPGPRDTGTVYKTTDGGVNWDTSYVVGANISGLANDPDSNNIVYMAAGNNLAESEGVYKTTDGGNNWFFANNELVDRMAVKVKIDPVSPNIIYAGTNGLGGVYKSLDKAATWTRICSGMRHFTAEAMCFDASNTLYAAAGWGTYRDIPCIFKSTDNGNSWDTLLTVPSPYFMTSIWDLKAYPDSSGLIFVAGMSHYSNTSVDPTLGFVYKTTNAGGTWEELWTTDSIWPFCLAIDSITGYMYAGMGGGDTLRIYKVFRSTDNGNTWNETSGWDYQGVQILDIAIDPKSTNILYAGTSAIVYKSTDYGANWQPKDPILSVYTILIDSDSTDIIYAGSGGPAIDSGAVYKSTNAGESWNKIGLDGYLINALIGKFGFIDTIYAGTGGTFLQATGQGVFRSIDGGSSWDPINVGLTAPFILTLAIDPISPNMIYAGTMAGGFFRFNELGVSENQDDVFNTPISLQVYPNPFKKQTEIAYSVGRNAYGAERIALHIYDVTGRLVRQYDDKTIGLSDHIVWQGTDDIGQKLPAGVYFIRLKVEKHSSIEKCVYVR